MEKRSFVMKLAVRFAVLFFLFPALLCLSADLESGTALFDYVGGDTPIVTNAWLNVSNSTHSLIEKIVAENVPTNMEIDTSSFVMKDYTQSGIEYDGEGGSPSGTFDNGPFSWTFGIAEMYHPDLIDKVNVSISTNGIVITGDTPKDGNPLNYISFERPNGDKKYLGDELANAGSVQSVNNVQPVNGNVHLEPDDIGALGINGIADRARIADSVDWLDITTKPDWVDSQTKPSYNANEVGAYTKGEVDEKVNSVSNIAVYAKEGLDNKRDKSDLKYELPEYADFISSYGSVYSYNAERSAELGRPIWIDEQTNDSLSYHGNNLWKWNSYAECVASEDALSLDFGEFGSYSRQSVDNPVQETKLATMLDIPNSITNGVNQDSVFSLSSTASPYHKISYSASGINKTGGTYMSRDIDKFNWITYGTGGERKYLGVTIEEMINDVVANISASTIGAAPAKTMLVLGGASPNYELRLNGVAQTFEQVSNYVANGEVIAKHLNGFYKPTYLSASEIMFDCTGFIAGDVSTRRIHMLKNDNKVALDDTKIIAEEGWVSRSISDATNALPDWTKSQSKPSYSPWEIGALGIYDTAESANYAYYADTAYRVESVNWTSISGKPTNLVTFDSTAEEQLDTAEKILAKAKDGLEVSYLIEDYGTGFSYKIVATNGVLFAEKVEKAQ